MDRAPDPATDIFLGHVLAHKEPLASYDAPSDRRVNQDVTGPMGAKSILAVPLVVQNRVLAVAMTGTFGGYRTFTAEQIELAWNIARVGALVIENARLHEERQVEKQSIQRVSNALLQELEIKEVLKVICTETQQLTGARGSAVYFLEDKEWLQLVFNTGEKPYFERIPAKGSMTELVLQEGKPLVSNSLADDKRIFSPSPGVRNLMVAPLRSNNATIGAIYAANKPWDFSEDDVRIVGLFADQAGLAIENAQLHERTRQMAALEERERLAREIHDNLAQTLSVLKLQASHVNELLGSGEYDRAQTCLTDIKKIVTDAHADARDAIFSLRSSATSTPEFLSTLQAIIERSRNIYGLDARLMVQDESHISMSTMAAIQLTRIIQEALTNVRKHAEASVVYIRLERSDDHLSITVEDNGQGFDPSELRKKDCGCEGVGLQIMRERADSLGGYLEIESYPGQGTRVITHVPLSDRSLKDDE
jgi:signal transduction histidine kinase